MTSAPFKWWEYTDRLDNFNLWALEFHPIVGYVRRGLSIIRDRVAYEKLFTHFQN